MKFDMNIEDLKNDLKRLSDPKKAKDLQWFFKTGPGEYGEGDVFIGIVVPKISLVAKKYRTLPLADAEKLLQSKIHEERMTALFIWVDQFAHGDETQKKKIFNAYLKNTAKINNWDLVDLTAPKIVGPYLEAKNRDILYKLAGSKSLWERRISILATFHFIKNVDFKDALKIAEKLLHDEHDLIQKAVGWMLREIGKRDMAVEENFLKKHYKAMPRTALRYAIEKFPEPKRQAYLKGVV